VNSREAPSPSPIDASDRDDEVARWLSDHGAADAWEIAPTLVAAGLGTDWLEELLAVTPPPHLDYGLFYPVRAIESDNLLDEITDGAERISDLLAAARQYTQMDRALLETFDVHDGLDAALTLLSHKLSNGIKVIRDYDRNLEPIHAYPAELNQVWTNLTDNAIDAMDGNGTLTVRTRADGARLMVESATAVLESRGRYGLMSSSRFHDQGRWQGHGSGARHRMEDRGRASWGRDRPRVGTRRHETRGHASSAHD
jgi:hypothetical protein